VKAKLKNIVDRAYIGIGLVLYLTRYFDLPNGEDDGRMIFDATVIGVNDALWAPTFMFPIMECLLMSVGPGTFMKDRDIGEMFYNFRLSPVV